MKLDNEDQRAILLQLIDNTTFPGKARHVINALAHSIETAEIEPVEVARKPTGGRNASV